MSCAIPEKPPAAVSLVKIYHPMGPQCRVGCSRLDHGHPDDDCPEHKWRGNREAEGRY